jgi:hypothetical protein
VGSGSHAQQTAAVLTSIEPVLIEQSPRIVVVYGDVNSTLAAALAAAAGASPVPKVGVPRLPGSSPWTSKTRLLSICSRKLTGGGALTGALHNAARKVKAAPGAAAAKGAVVGLSLAELAAITCCVKKCIEETL